MIGGTFSLPEYLISDQLSMTNESQVMQNFTCHPEGAQLLGKLLHPSKHPNVSQKHHRISLTTKEEADLNL